jgi:ketosteroid isomerase-like protein
VHRWKAQGNRRFTAIIKVVGGSVREMSEENVEIVRRFFDTYRQGDYEGSLQCLAPDVVYKVAQEAPARGPDAVRAIWERWEDAWEELETTPEEFIDAGDRVFVTVRYTGRGRASGIEFDTRTFEVCTLRDGKIVDKVEFTERSAALEAAGLRE